MQQSSSITPHHFWDYADAKTATAYTAAGKMLKGWKLYAVSQGLCFEDNAYLYQHALVSPHAQLLRLSTRTVQALQVQPEKSLLSLNMLVLPLVGATKPQLLAWAKERGLSHPDELRVKWNADRQCWTIRPQDAKLFPQWVDTHQAPILIWKRLEESVRQ